MTTDTTPTPRRILPVFLAAKPSNAQSLPSGRYLWRYAFKRNDGNWRMGVVDADTRLNAGHKLQAANPMVDMHFKAHMENMRHG